LKSEPFTRALSVNPALSRLIFYALQGDWHLHDSHSHDGRGAPADFARAATAKGLSSICFTNHIEELDSKTMTFEVKLPRDLEKMKKSLAAIREARPRFPGLDIKFGVEVENNPRCYPQMEAVLDALPFDYVVGSVHLVDGVPITSSFSKPFILKHDPESLYKKYYEEMSAFVEWGRFDCLAHPDIIRRYMVELFPDFKPYISYDMLRNVFTLLRNRGQGIEVNTGGLFEAPKDAYHEQDILNLALDCGIERLIIGSDAHKPEDLGRGYNLLEERYHI
jgi:histidinol-phosphatase (PHP family)